MGSKGGWHRAGLLLLVPILLFAAKSIFGAIYWEVDHQFGWHDRMLPDNVGFWHKSRGHRNDNIVTALILIVLALGWYALMWAAGYLLRCLGFSSNDGDN